MSTAQGGALVMPTSYAVMNQEEMEYLEGGGMSVDMEPRFTKRSECLSFAQKCLEEDKIKGMSDVEIAQEIFAHAIVYFGVAGINSIGLNNVVLQALKGKANPINIEDGGDTRPGFKQAYALIWYYYWYM